VSPLSVIAFILDIAVRLFIMVMWGRFIVDLIPLFSRGWRPRGFLLVISEIIFTITDPPIKAVRRILPPLRTSGASIDFSWSIVLIAAIIVSYILRIFIG
jgi:YggT family protein